MVSNMTLSILVVDDSKAILHFMQAQLEIIGVDRVHLCSDPRQVQNLLSREKHPFDGVFLDLNMPHIDGMTVLKELANIGYCGGVGIISEMEPRILELAADIAKQSKLYLVGGIPKPIDANELALAVMKIKQPAIHKTRNFSLSEAELDAVFESGKVQSYFQPQVSLVDNRIIGMECLIRIDTVKYGMLPAYEFVPYAERTGKIHELFKVMLPRALHGFKQCLNEYNMTLTMSLNLSADQLEDTDLPIYIENQCGLFGINPENICLEVTESQVLDKGHKLETLNRLRIKGYRLSLDDFGTGFTNFHQLCNLPFNEVKIDRELSHGIAKNKSSALVVETVVRLGEERGFNVLAEGVEHAEDIELLVSLGVHLFQGFQISRPKPFEEVIHWIHAWEKVMVKQDES